MAADAPQDPFGSADKWTERERLQRLYESYNSSPYYRRIWLPDSAGSRLMAEHKWGLISAVLLREAVAIHEAWILDLGVGSGLDAARFKALDVRSERFVGLDLLENNARDARSANPWMNALAGDAGSLPFPDGRFDLVYQSTMLSSILNASLRERICREIARVLVPGGLFLSYDTRYPNPWNPHTRPLRTGEFRRAFPGWRVSAWSSTAIPQLQRALAPFSLAACRLLEGIPLLRCHLLVLARKI